MTNPKRLMTEKNGAKTDEEKVKAKWPDAKLSLAFAVQPDKSRRWMWCVMSSLKSVGTDTKNCEHWWRTLHEPGYGYVSTCVDCGERESGEHSDACLFNIVRHEKPCECGAAEDFYSKKFGTL